MWPRRISIPTAKASTNAQKVDSVVAKTKSTLANCSSGVWDRMR